MDSMMLFAVVAVALAQVAMGIPLTTIANKGTKNWRSEVAMNETRQDIQNYVQQYDELRPNLIYMWNLFLETRIKDLDTIDENLPRMQRFRSLALWGMGFGRLLEITGYQNNALYERIVDVAKLLIQGYAEEESYVENRVMRGWPMYVDPRDSMKRFESFQSGHITTAIAMAAHAAGRRGDHMTAAELLGPVLSTQYDMYLTEDVEKLKLDRRKRVVYIPAGASRQRKDRHLEAVGGGAAELCISQPEAYNHGLIAAGSAIAASQAMMAIDWDRVEFPLKDLSLRETEDRLTEMIVKNSLYFKEALQQQPPTGSDPRDNYPGPSGTAWYVWDYRDLSKCPQAHGSNKDRPEDIAHTQYDIDFIVDFRKWVSNLPGRTRHVWQGIFSPRDFHRLIVTYLNRIVHDYDAPPDERYACDVMGLYDGDDWGNSKKQCENPARAPETRPGHAVGFLPLAFAIRDKLKKDSQLSCDAFRMVSDILQFALPGDDFYSFSFYNVTRTSGAKIIQAKHYFYNFRRRLKDACEAESVE